MPHTPNPLFSNTHQQEAEQLLREYLHKLHNATQLVDHDTHTREDHRVACEQLQTHQAYLLSVIVAGLQTGRVPF